MTDAAAVCRQFVEATTSGIWMLDGHDVTTLVNPAMADMLGYAPIQMHGRRVFDYIEPMAIIQTRRELELCRQGTSVRVELPLRRSDGEIAWTILSAIPLSDAKHGPDGTLAMITDVSELTEMKQRLAFLSDHDPLTGLLNRRRFLEDLDRQLEYAARSHRSGAVLTLDLDNFSVANELYGRQAGDAMLMAVAEALHVGLGRGEVAARTGNDDFAVALPEATEDEAIALANRLRAHLRKPSSESAHTVSVGVVCFSGVEPVTAEDLLVRADLARRQATEEGGDRIQSYRPQMPALTGLERVRAALAEDRLILYGQPVLDLRTGSTTHHELLVRMLTEDGELIAPGMFLPIAQRFGLIQAIDRWVTDAAVALAFAGRPVSVNLSSSSIGDPEIVATLRSALDRGLPPSRLMFELSEADALMNVEGMSTFADALHRLGVSLAVDDFGAGFGSFSFLKRVPARFLKINMGLVSAVSASRTDLEVMKSIVAMSRSLNKVTIAKGVEDSETLTLLRCYGVDQAQGFHLGAPARMSLPVAGSRSPEAKNRPLNVSPPPAAPRPSEPHPQPNGEAPARPRVLLAEDNEVNQLAAVRLLEKCGYDVDVVDNGRKAVESARRGGYTAILMDCQLPEFDGYQATQAIRQVAAYGDRTPIIALTANSAEGNQERCAAAGMDAYLSKPLRWATLKETLAQVVMAAASPRWSPSDQAGATRLVDLGLLAELDDRDSDMADDIVRLFCEESRRQLNRLGPVIAKRDATAIYDIVSRLKGGCANVGAVRMLELCDQITGLAEQGKVKQLSELESALADAFERTKRLISRDAEGHRAAPGIASREIEAGATL